jgi:O-acetylhomoserine/O-acetylserine sulfhydrylase-like pyridoxal-dependent enzyme
LKTSKYGELGPFFQKKKSFECVEISILKTGRNYAEVQKIKRKHYIAIFPFFLQKNRQNLKKIIGHIWTLTSVW